MPQTYDIDGTCPVCGDTMVITRLSCGRCGSSLEGAFRLTIPLGGGAAARGTVPTTRDGQTRFGRLARLDRAQLEFVEAFLRCEGVIKNVEDMLGISYPTVKRRLANVLAAMGLAQDEDQPAAAESRRIRREILADLAAGRITMEDAHRKLAEIQTAGDDSEGDGGGGGGGGEHDDTSE